MSLLNFLPSSKIVFKSLKCLFQLVFLLSLLAYSLFYTQPSTWDLENTNQISLHPCEKLSNVSHHIGEYSKFSKWSTRPNLVLSLLQSHFLPLSVFSTLLYILSFLLLFEYVRLTSFAHALLLFFFCLTTFYPRC